MYYSTCSSWLVKSMKVRLPEKNKQLSDLQEKYCTFDITGKKDVPRSVVNKNG